MAFNGGATAATVDTIQKAGNWSATGLGLLGAMDKIGMTMSAAFWGYVLQRRQTKTLLVFGIGINAGSVLLFGMIDHWTAMYAAKLAIGFTEGLQWVWTPLWIAKWADKDSLSVWMNLSGGVAAGVGSGLGIIIAGFTTSCGMSYAFAFTLEGCVLLLLWLELLLLIPSEKLGIGHEDEGYKKFDPLHAKRLKKRLRTESQEWEQTERGKRQFKARLHSHSLDSIHLDDPEIDIREQLRTLWCNELFLRTGLAYASINFVVSGLQFMWIRMFVTLWSLQKSVSVLSFLVISAAGGGIGVALGSHQEAGDAASCRGPALVFIWNALLSASCGACACFCMLLVQLTILNLDWMGSLLLLGSWTALFAVLVGVNATPGLLQIVCTQSVESDNLKSLATGLYQSVNNFLGFAMGPFLPQVVIDIMSKHLTFPQALVAGVTTTLGAVVAAFLLSGLAWRATKALDGYGSLEDQPISRISETTLEDQPTSKDSLGPVTPLEGQPTGE
mmetsp:Transcript_148897/g.285230  ORF Transcript_148897/g.285230 Transcript_148897/m.285230 type:complete len:501 (-) Transcript_148897:16-1518(-)